MEGLIGIAFWLFIIIAIFGSQAKKKGAADTQKPAMAEKPAAAQQSAMPQRPAVVQKPAMAEKPMAVQKPAGYRRAAAAQKPAESRMAVTAGETRPNAIVEKAKSNAAAQAEDLTLQEIEASHGHAEHQEEEAVPHSRSCQTLEAGGKVTEAWDNLLGTTEDLMVKGYDGNLQFERDFVGEALDMLGHISEV